MAVLVSTIRMLRRTFPDSGITALVSDPDFTRRKCPSLDARLERWPWPVPGKERMGIIDKAGWPFILLGHYISALAFRLTKKEVFLFNGRFREPMRSFFHSDIVLSPGGDFISPKYGFFSTFNEYILAKILGKKLIICAQTIGPFEGLLNGHVAGFVLGLADLVIVRERKTARLLEEIGLRKHKLTADIVFTLPEIEKNAGKRILVCPEKMRGDEKGIYIAFFRELTARMREEFGCEITYFPANSADIEFQNEIVAPFGEGVNAVPDVLSPLEIARMASESEFIVSSRMHPIVLGTLSSTPFFSIGDSFKFSYVLGDFYDNSTLKISELGEIGNVEKVLEKIRERKMLSGKIAKRMERVRERSFMSEKILKETVDGWVL